MENQTKSNNSVTYILTIPVTSVELPYTCTAKFVASMKPIATNAMNIPNYTFTWTSPSNLSGDTRSICYRAYYTTRNIVGFTRPRKILIFCGGVWDGPGKSAQEFLAVIEVRNWPVVSRIVPVQFRFLDERRDLSDFEVRWEERFEKWNMRNKNVEEHALMSDVGIKLRLDDLGCKEWRSSETSAGMTGVTGETVEKMSQGLYIWTNKGIESRIYYIY